ncbi:MAG: hypothetical protein WCQ69_02015 [Bacteroidales bacterium]|jgi:hypothetical protein|nr:hypothetical protein [Bacteroidales bacterium]MDD2831382.1 hypothetical protein [Bacteroidales bacterium]MDD3208376.1 hypothetical protein [Bacteroidales bacterium]MDD3696941.1 hypothetical protein [Bacteroidales bacterium]MDD4167593.1 hypothetical protein [Bacteroidales bacterium]
MIIKMLTIHATVILSVGTIWGLIMYFFIPQWWFPAYPVIPATFLAIGLLETLILNKNRNRNKKVLNSMLIQRLVRWGIVLVVLVLLIRLARPPKISLIISFMGMFMVYSFLSIWFLMSENRSRKDTGDQL